MKFLKSQKNPPISNAEKKLKEKMWMSEKERQELCEEQKTQFEFILEKKKEEDSEAKKE